MDRLKARARELVFWRGAFYSPGSEIEVAPADRETIERFVAAGIVEWVEPDRLVEEGPGAEVPPHDEMAHHEPPVERRRRGTAVKRRR
jgi:hypothetical protein